MTFPSPCPTCWTSCARHRPSEDLMSPSPLCHGSSAGVGLVGIHRVLWKTELLSVVCWGSLGKAGITGVRISHG